MDADTLEAMCQFFLRHMAYAGRGWGAPQADDPAVRCLRIISCRAARHNCIWHF